MSLVVTCRCGQQFKTGDRHAGKRVPCPACGHVMSIPNAGAAPAQPPPLLKQHGVRVQCPCGWAFQAPPECEGKTVRCPGCNGAISVPSSDPLGVGPLEQISATPLHSGYGFDSTERLAKQLAWIAGGSVALMLFGMFITYLIFRLPNRPQVTPVMAEAPAATLPSSQPAAPSAKPPAPAPTDNRAVAVTADSARIESPSVGVRGPAFGPPPSPGAAVATDAGRSEGPSDPFDRMKVGPRGPRFGPRGPRVGPRGPRLGPTESGNQNTAPGETEREAEQPPVASPALAANAGPPAVTKLPNSVQAWFEQPGDKLTGLRRVGSEQSPNAHFSWMTALLPFLDHQHVYEKLDFNQPVDSDRNLKAGATQVPAFLNPLDDRKSWEGYPFHGLALTHFVGMSGVEDSRNLVAAKLARSDPRAGVFGYDEVAKPKQITDGQSQTIMMTGAGDLSNPWLFGGGGTIRGAREPLFDKTSGLGTKGLPGGGTIAVMADGSVRHVNSSVDPKVFKAMSTIHGAESVDLERSAPIYALDQLRPTDAGAPPSSSNQQRATGR